MWVVLTTTRVYFTGVTLARSRLLSASGSGRTRAWAPIAIIVLALAIVGRAVAMAVAAEPPTGVEELVARLDDALRSGAARVVLWPFVTLSRPLFVPWGVEFVVAMASAVGVLAVTTIWVLQTDGGLQAVAADAAAKRAASSRSGGTPAIRAGATGLTLAASGRPEAVFFWKNGVQTLRSGGSTLIRYLVPVVGFVTLGLSVAFSSLHMRGGAGAGFTIAAIVTLFVAVLGPQMLRADLRNDLRHLELLKTWPVQASAVVRGEMLWVSTLLTGCGWLAIVCAAMLSAAAFPEVPLPTRLVVALCALLLMPALVTAQYLVHAAAAVIFPAWVPTGNQRPRGLDAMGQRLIMLAGVLLSVIVLLLPGAIAGGVVWFALQRFIGLAAFVPAAMACTAIVAIEVLAWTEALGPLFEKLDVLSVERGE